MNRELKYLFWLFLKRHFGSITYRLFYYALKPAKRDKRIWLITDSGNRGGDNGSYLFKYAAWQEDRQIVPYYGIHKSTREYKEYQQFGRVLDFASTKYKCTFLLADKIVSAHFDESIINAFGGGFKYVADLCHYDFVFLGHGIMGPDLSKLINRQNKNIRLIAAAVESEAESLKANKQYDYDSSHIVTTGYPRFDGLKNKADKTLIIMPTWRQHLVKSLFVGGHKTANGHYLYNSKFIDSDFYQFYNALINDSRLTDALQRTGYSGELYLHPSFSAQWQDFKENEQIKLMPPPHDYEMALVRGDVMLTDYSGVAFDFAYMKKPVVYGQFDRGSFYDNHSYGEGYFSFEKDGFGPVLYDYESTVSRLVQMLETGCRIEPKYAKRIDNFFYRLDHNNSQRVYEAIRAIDE